jgi:hypothetical protein
MEELIAALILEEEEDNDLLVYCMTVQRTFARKDIMRDTTPV